MSFSKYALSRLLNAATTESITSAIGPLAAAVGANILGLAPPCPRAGAWAATVVVNAATAKTMTKMDRFIGLPFKFSLMGFYTDPCHVSRSGCAAGVQRVC